jgi:hypothetical protein
LFGAFGVRVVCCLLFGLLRGFKIIDLGLVIWNLEFGLWIWDYGFELNINLSNLPNLLNPLNPCRQAATKPSRPKHNC